MPKITHRQEAILAQAAKRPSRLVLPLPTALKINAGTAARLLKGLLSQKLIEARKATKGEPVWKTDEEGIPLTLIATEAACAALMPKARPRQETAARSTKKTLKAPRTESKLAVLLSLLRRPIGANVAELQAAIGWQAHSVRGTISGNVKKRLGLAVGSEVEPDRGRVYRIDTAGGAS